jgi:hypothetical protein
LNTQTASALGMLMTNCIEWMAQLSNAQTGQSSFTLMAKS